MLWITVFFSVVILAIFVSSALKGNRSNALVLCCSSFFLCGCVGSIACPIQSVLLLLTLLTLRIPNFGPCKFILTSVVATLVAFILPLTLTILEHRKIERLREENPVMSVESRVPKPVDSPFLREANRKWVPVPYEEKLPVQENRGWNSQTEQLRRLHEKQHALFVTSPGFGIARMPATSVSGLKSHPVPDSIDQPVPPQPNDYPAGNVLPSAKLPNAIVSLHTNGVLDFVNPNGFGYVKSPTEVVGFKPHRFSELPSANANWKVQSVELVGVLKHDRPRVYVSDHLPRMDELKDAKTRIPDAFEEEGLSVIAKGEDLFARGEGDSLRLIGAIRSAKQCMECHGGSHGDLLGAFSYRLKR